jgi:hypothetical protein
MRHTSKVVAATCAAVCLGLATASAQGPPATPAGGPPAAATPALSSKPFQRLFELQRDLEAARRKVNEALRPNSSRRFICGTPVLRADPAIDPRSIVRPPETGVRFEIRTVPPTCR